jgi:hypothetical protein
MDAYYRRNFPQSPIAEPLLDDPGVIAGNIAGLERSNTDVVVSLCRMYSVPLCDIHVDVRLIDEASPGANPNLDFVIEHAVLACSRRSRLEGYHPGVTTSPTLAWVSR